MVSNYEFLTLKIVLIIEGKSNRKLPKMFADENLRITEKKIKKGLTQCFKNRCVRGC